MVTQRFHMYLYHKLCGQYEALNSTPIKNEYRLHQCQFPDFVKILQSHEDVTNGIKPNYKTSLGTIFLTWHQI